MSDAKRKTVSFPPIAVFPSGSVNVATAGISSTSFAPGAITATAFAAAALTEPKFGDGAISARVIATAAIEADAFAAAAIANAAFAAGALTGQLIKSVQQVTITIPAATASKVQTINAINTSRSLVMLAGSNGGSSITQPAGTNALVRFNAADQVIAIHDADVASLAMTVQVFVLEFF